MEKLVEVAEVGVLWSAGYQSQLEEEEGRADHHQAHHVHHQEGQPAMPNLGEGGDGEDGEDDEGKDYEEDEDVDEQSPGRWGDARGSGGRG